MGSILVESTEDEADLSVYRVKQISGVIQGVTKKGLQAGTRVSWHEELLSRSEPVDRRG